MAELANPTDCSVDGPWHDAGMEAGKDQADVLVIGLGEVGGPLLEVLGNTYRAVGRDIEDCPLREVPILHLCFPFGEGFVQKATQYVLRYKPELVIINSTVLPGTTRAISEESATAAVYSPVRGKHTRMKEELHRYAKFVAGSSPWASDIAEGHFGAAGIPTERMSSFEVLELAKLLETTYFGVMIGWAQEMDRFASTLGVDYWEAAQFFDEIDFLPPVRFQPGFIGGHCVMPNLDLLGQVRQSVFVDALRDSNAMRETEWRALGRALSERLFPASKDQGR